MGRRKATLPSHFHVGLHTVHACESSPAALAVVLSYLHRRRECDVRHRCTVVDAHSYLLRLAQHAEAKAAVIGHRFFCRGTMTEDEVWAGIDGAARTKDGRYHRRAGGKPRLAILVELSLPWDLPEAEKIRLSHEIAQRIVDGYGAAVTSVCHRRLERPENGADHVHLLISMREVDENGIGPMIRLLNGMASRRGHGERMVIGPRTLAAFPMWMRENWAELLGEATGVQYSPLSYADQGLDLEPCRALTRPQIEVDRRNGGVLKAERAAFLADRNAAFLRRAKGRAAQRSISPPAESLASKLTRIDARLAALSAFNPMSILAFSAQGFVETEPTTTVVARPERTEKIFPGPSPTSLPAGARSFEGSDPHPRARTHAAPRLNRSPSQTTLSPVHALSSPPIVPAPPAPTLLGTKSADAHDIAADPPRKTARRTELPIGRILEEGIVQGRVAPPGSQRPATGAQPAGISQSDAAAAIAFSAAMILSGWRTDRGEAELAEAIGWSRNNFSIATQSQAIEIRNRQRSPAIAREEAKSNATAAMRLLFEQLEEERREAKRERKRAAALRESQSGDIPTVNDHHLSFNDGNATTRTPDPDATMPRGNADQKGSGARLRADTQAGQPPAYEPTSAADRSIKAGVLHTAIEVILDLAALLAWRGRQHVHIDTLCGLSGWSPDRIRAEANLRLQAFAQIKDFWATTARQILDRARTIADHRVQELVSAIEGKDLKRAQGRDAVPRSPGKDKDSNIRK